MSALLCSETGSNPFILTEPEVGLHRPTSGSVRIKGVDPVSEHKSAL